MPRLFLPNFEFEWTLAHPGRRTPQPLRKLADELAITWLAIAESDDLLPPPATWRLDAVSDLAAQLPWPPPRLITDLSQAPPNAVLTPWGWTADIVAIAGEARLSLPAHPDLDVVRRVNSRQFSLDLENSLGSAIPDARILDSLDAVDLCLAEFSAAHGTHAPWVLKANFSNSARERLRGSGRTLSTHDRGWAEARLQTGPLAFEPWVEIEAEAGVQWDVPRTGPPILVGVTPLVCDAAGQYRGSLFAATDVFEHDWEDAIALSRRAALRIQSEGYIGPLGIDACRYRDRGELRLRPVQDINARWTMGRLSLGWRRLLSPGEWGVWRFGPDDSPIRLTDARLDSPPTRVIVTSANRLDGGSLRLPHRLEIRRS